MSQPDLTHRTPTSHSGSICHIYMSHHGVTHASQRLSAASRALRASADNPAPDSTRKQGKEGTNISAAELGAKESSRPHRYNYSRCTNDWSLVKSSWTDWAGEACKTKQPNKLRKRGCEVCPSLPPLKRGPPGTTTHLSNKLKGNRLVIFLCSTQTNHTGRPEPYVHYAPSVYTDWLIGQVAVWDLPNVFSTRRSGHQKKSQMPHNPFSS